MHPPVPSEQIRRGGEFYRNRKGAKKFIAYFQTFTNTYAPCDQLERLYDEALAQEDVIGLSIGTRPDCVSDDVLNLLKGYARERHVWLEFGLQSIHDETLLRINRGHTAAQFFDAILRAADDNLLICTHIIAGLPGEHSEDVRETAATLASLPISGIKIHSLLALEGTAMGEEYKKGQLTLWTQEEYVKTVCDVLEILPPDMVIQRLTADGYQDIFLAPTWATNKMKILNAIDRELERRNTRQGYRYRGDRSMAAEI